MAKGPAASYNTLRVIGGPMFGGGYPKGFPGGSDGRESISIAGDLGLISGLGRSTGGGHGNPLQYSWLENPCGQRSLAGYSPCSCKKSDITEWLSTTTTLQGHSLPFHIQKRKRGSIMGCPRVNSSNSLLRPWTSHGSSYELVSGVVTAE